MREYLIYCSSNRGDFAADLLAPSRTWDLALNDYSGDGELPGGAEYSHSVDRGKFTGARELLGERVFAYRGVAFLDDDVAASADTLKRLFEVGRLLDLDLWQPALTRESYGFWNHLKQAPGSLVRAAPFVEIMCPFFSAAGLRSCWQTFDAAESGYGLDNVWRELLGRRRMAVVDALPVLHCRPPGSGKRRHCNGRTSSEELSAVWRNTACR